MTRRSVGRVCIQCGKMYDPTNRRSSRCRTCETKRTQERPWYRTTEYRKMQAIARTRVGWNCPRCGHPMRGRYRPSVDHINPVSRGGAQQGGPYQIVCLVCNISKLNRHA